MHLIATATILLASAALSPAVLAQSDDAGAPQKAEVKKEKKICRTIRNTGMRTAARQCKTVEQWDADEQRADGSDLQMKTDGLQSN